MFVRPADFLWTIITFAMPLRLRITEGFIIVLVLALYLLWSYLSRRLSNYSLGRFLFRLHCSLVMLTTCHLKFLLLFSAVLPLQHILIILAVITNIISTSASLLNVDATRNKNGFEWNKIQGISLNRITLKLKWLFSVSGLGIPGVFSWD